MSSATNSFTMGRATANTTNPTRAMWGRLLWKDAREIVPIWITLLLAAMLCLSVSCWMVNSRTAHIAPLYISGHTFIALIGVITGVFLLANEDENRTLHLLRNLPLPPKQIVWQKLLLGSIGVILLACLIAGFTILLATFTRSSPLEAKSSYGFTVANIVLLPLLYLVIASLSSMVSRSHFYGVLIAGCISIGAIALLEPSWLGGREGALALRSGIRWLWVAMTVVGGVCALVLGATGWIEEKVVAGPRLKSHPSELTSTDQQTAGTTYYAFPALLWQSFRQSRTLLLSCFGLTVVGWIVIMAWGDYSHPRNNANYDDLPIMKTTGTLLWTWAVAILFASSVFLDDKRQNNFLFFQQNRERGRWFWLSRLLPFWAMALLLTLAWNSFVFDLGQDFLALSHDQWQLVPRDIQLGNSIGLQAASQSFVVPLLVLLGIIGIGQYFSMFVRNPILAFVFAGVVNVIFVGLVGYVVFVNQSVWLFIVPPVLAGYLATWWRSKFWLATSPQARQYLMPIVLPVIVFAIVAAAFINSRATEFGDVQFDASNFAAWNRGALLDLDSQQGSKLGLQRVEFGTESQRQQAATLYREAIALFQDGDRNKNSLMDTAPQMPWPAEKTAKFVSRNQVAIDKIIEASLLPACAPFLSDARNTRDDERWALQTMALVNSHHQLLESNLSAAKRSIDAYDRVLQRANASASTTRYDSGYYGLLIAWADHPDQKLDAIKTAISILEGSDSDIRPTKIVNSMGSDVETDSAMGLNLSRLYREFGGERAFMDLQYEIASLQKDDLNHRIAELKNNYRLMPWEYQRQLQVCQLRTIQAFNLDRYIYRLYPIGNDRSLDYLTIDRQLAAKRYWPPIAIEEDRTVISKYLYSWNYGAMYGILEEANWRRYTLLRLGLAAYKIEHENYPDDLLQLESYYAHDLPTTTYRRMFGWFKEGLEADLVTVAKDANSDLLVLRNKLADRDLPLLLPFSVASDKPLPQPVKYGEGKLGIDLDLLTDNRIGYVPGFRNFTQYEPDWTVGVEAESSP